MHFTKYSDEDGPIDAEEHPHLITCYESSDRIQGHYDIIIYGGLLMVMVMFMPGGLVRGVPDLIRKLLKKGGSSHA